MKKELENFIIESDIELDYFNDVVDYIIDNEKRILDFFKLEKLPNRVKIFIMSYEPFKKFIVSKYGEILDYVIGDSDSKTDTIRILNISDQIKYTIHKNASIASIKETALHEIIHQCHRVHNKDFNETIWFSEGLATNLSYQKNKITSLDDCDFDRLKKDFRHYKGNYSFAYTILNYVLNNYSDEEITKLYSDSNYLRGRADSIFKEVKNWVNEKIK